MADSSAAYHESLERLSSATQDKHRSLVSLQEELEAIDWYQQRAEASEDELLKGILLHNMREEIEHAAMILEWLRRNDADFDKQLRAYLFTDAPIVRHEEKRDTPTDTTTPSMDPSARGMLTIGKLKGV